jgi:hypothetical protein
MGGLNAAYVNETITHTDFRGGTLDVYKLLREDCIKIRSFYAQKLIRGNTC